MTVAVTTTLFVGDAEMPFQTTCAGTASEAVEVIRAGGSARVTSFDVAADVLRLLGLTEQVVEDRLHFAQTGAVLRAV